MKSPIDKILFLIGLLLIWCWGFSTPLIFYEQTLEPAELIFSLLLYIMGLGVVIGCLMTHFIRIRIYEKIIDELTKNPKKTHKT